MLAKENGVPVYSVVPTSTIDLTISSGNDIVIEERKAGEVTDLRFMGEAAAPVRLACNLSSLASTFYLLSDYLAL